MFLGSAGIGVVFALLSALTLKHVALRDYTSLELCILIIFIYAPYALAEGIHLSGVTIVLGIFYIVVEVWGISCTLWKHVCNFLDSVDSYILG